MLACVLVPAKAWSCDLRQAENQSESHRVAAAAVVVTAAAGEWLQ